jgi:hypothetical protein
MISSHGKQGYPQPIDTSEYAIGFQGIHAGPKGDASATFIAHRLHQCELLFIGSSVIMNNNQTWKNFSFIDGYALADITLWLCLILPPTFLCIAAFRAGPWGRTVTSPTLSYSHSPTPYLGLVQGAPVQCTPVGAAIPPDTPILGLAIGWHVGWRLICQLLTCKVINISSIGGLATFHCLRH